MKGKDCGQLSKAPESGAAEAPARASLVTTRFGATVKRMRYDLGISQETLAERADLHRTYIAGVEAGGRNVTLKTLERLARALQVSMSSLLIQPEPSAGRDELAHGARVRRERG